MAYPIEGGFRNSALEPGMALGNYALGVVLIADNTNINPQLNGMIALGSNDTTAANRTFSLTDGLVDGQILYINFYTAASTKAQLLNSGNVVLAADWAPTLGSSIQLIWIAIASKWYEVSRNDYSAGIAALQAEVDALDVRVTAAEGDITALEGDVTALQASEGAAGPYTPSTGADWVDPDPTTIQSALDRIAAVVETLNAGPIA